MKFIEFYKRPTVGAAIFVVCVIGAFAFFFNSGEEDVVATEDEVYQSFQGKTFVDEIVEETPQGAFKHIVEIYPKEIYIGDPVYVVSYYENVSDSDIFPFRDEEAFLDRNHILYLNATVSSEKSADTYRWAFESGRRSAVTLAGPRGAGRLVKDQKMLESIAVCEFPPLYDLRSPFWKDVRNDLPPKGTTCVLEFYTRYFTPDEDGFAGDGVAITLKTRKITADILVKPRPNAENELLDRWFDNTPKEIFPVAEEVKYAPGEFKVAKVKKTSAENGLSDVMISGKAYSPWLFIRFGNRKPSVPNNPTTLEGWRELESSLAPSVMRDEIHLTRLLLEYYSAKSSSKTQKAKMKICDWFKTLPRAQRLALCPSPIIDGGRLGGFGCDEMKEKSQELKRAIREENAEFEFYRQY